MGMQKLVRLMTAGSNKKIFVNFLNYRAFMGFAKLLVLVLREKSRFAFFSFKWICAPWLATAHYASARASHNFNKMIFRAVVMDIFH